MQVLVTDDIAGLTAAAQWGTGRGAGNRWLVFAV